MPGMHMGGISNSSFIRGSIKSRMEDATVEHVKQEEMYERCSLLANIEVLMEMA